MGHNFDSKFPEPTTVGVTEYVQPGQPIVLLLAVTIKLTVKAGIRGPLMTVKAGVHGLDRLVQLLLQKAMSLAPKPLRAQQGSQRARHAKSAAFGTKSSGTEEITVLSRTHLAESGAQYTRVDRVSVHFEVI